MAVNIKTLRELAEISFTELAVQLKEYLESLDKERLEENNLEEKEYFAELFSLLRQKQNENLEDEWTNYVLNKAEDFKNQKFNELQAALDLFESSSAKLQQFLQAGQSEEVEIKNLEDVINNAIEIIDKLIGTIVNTFCSGNSFMMKIMKGSEPPFVKHQRLSNIAFVVNPEAKMIDEKIRLTAFLEALINLRKTKLQIKEKEKVRLDIERITNSKYRMNIWGGKTDEERLKELEDLSKKLSAKNLISKYNRAINKINNPIKQVTEQINIEVQKSNLRGNNSLLIKELEKERLKWIFDTREKRSKIISDLQKEKVKFFGQTSRIEQLSFEIFPKGKLTVDELVKLLRLRGISVGTFGKLRLNKIEEHFDYEVKCIGKGDFDGYIIYRFKDNDIVIAEKPAYGNATYLVKGKWKNILTILQLSRGDARSLYPHQVKRVIHNDEIQWLNELKYKFENWY